MINGCCDVVTFQLYAYPTPLLNGRGSSSCLQEARGLQVVLLINRVIQQGCGERAQSPAPGKRDTPPGNLKMFVSNAFCS